MNPMSIMKIMGAKKQFQQTHPKFYSFIEDTLRNPIEQGTVIEITITRPDGTPVTGNMKVQQSDLELVQQLREVSGQ